MRREPPPYQKNLSGMKPQPESKNEIHVPLNYFYILKFISAMVLKYGYQNKMNLMGYRLLSSDHKTLQRMEEKKQGKTMTIHQKYGKGLHLSSEEYTEEAG